MFGKPVPEERPDRPLAGFKLARAVLSADGRRAGFSGLSIGAGAAYGVVAEASCVWSRRHAPPKRRCGCGFYCLSALADARALRCVTENQAAALLEVAASGRFIRYERGLRYSHQRVRAVWVGRCACGRTASQLASAGRGFVGWQVLEASCAVCAAGRSAMLLDEFAARMDGEVAVRPEPSSQGAPVPSALAATDSAAVLTAEITLMQARLDDLQARVNRYYIDPGAAG